MKCQARIVKTYKTKKANCVWPETVYGPVPEESLEWKEVCGGDLTAKVRAVDDPYYGGSSADLELEVECSRCRAGYFPGIFSLMTEVSSSDNSFNITPLLEEYKKDGN